jgi:hypothetical protein
MAVRPMFGVALKSCALIWVSGRRAGGEFTSVCFTVPLLDPTNMSCSVITPSLANGPLVLRYLYLLVKVGKPLMSDNSHELGHSIIEVGCSWPVHSPADVGTL